MTDDQGMEFEGVEQKMQLTQLERLLEELLANRPGSGGIMA